MNEYLAELIGTMILIIFGAGVCANVNLKKTLAHGSDWIVIAFGWGFGVAFGVYAVGQFSGAHLNPAVSIGLAAAGDFEWAKVPGYIIAQIIGGFIGAVIVWVQYATHFNATEDQGAQLGTYSTSPAIPNYVNNFLSEIIGTAVLLLGLLFIGANQFTDGLNPLIVGFLIVAIGLSLGGTTGYAINPARDLGPRIAHMFLPIKGKGSSHFEYAIVPFLGPIAGAMLGSVVYMAAFEGIINHYLWITIVVVVLTLALGVFLNKKVYNNQFDRML